MRYYPAFLDLRGRACLVIGGGTVAERKIRGLLAAGAVVTVVSPELTPALRELAASRVISHRPKDFEEQDLHSAFLAIAATDSADVNARAAHACRNGNILVNVAFPPEESTFIVPSSLERGDLAVAVSTSGTSPALAKKIRRDLERVYGPEYGVFLSKLGEVRKRLMQEVPDEAGRREILHRIVESDVLELLRLGKTAEADARLRELAGLRG